jgi:hypothetical protein
MLSNPTLYSISESKYILQSIIGALTIQNTAKIYNDKYVLDSFQSTLVMQNSEIYDIDGTDSMIKISASDTNIENMNFHDIIALSNANNPLIRIAFESDVTINGLKYYDSQGVFMTLVTSAADIAYLEIYNVTATSTYPMVDFDENTNLQFSHWSLTNFSVSGANYIAEVTNSNISMIENVTISEINQNPLRFFNNLVTLIDGLNINN